MAYIEDESPAIINDESGDPIEDEAGLIATTDWLQTQLAQYNYEPQRRFYLGTSDYSDRVIRWPRISRSANELKSVKINVPLANNDGELNSIYDQTYTLVNTVSIQIGDTHPTSGWEDIDLFTGYLYGVKYKNKQCIIQARDRLYDFTQMKAGDTSSIVEIPSSGGIVPSDIAWTLLTCYGELDATQGASNIDIDWEEFETWADQFSTDNVLAHGFYDGTKIIEALDELSKYTDSAVVIEGDGKIHFKKFQEVNSLDHTWTHDEITKLEIDVNKRRLVNKQFVSWDYSIDSDYYQGNVFDINTTSVNTFGLREETLEMKSIWYVDSISALNVAQRRVSLFSNPPKVPKLRTGLPGIWRKIGETARFVDSFFNVTSAAGWRIVEQSINLHDCLIDLDLDEAAVSNAFYLDVSTLDGDHLLL
jgi:hypothetical protein